jgi:GMP synthase-like glutamine amidotransferase
MRQYNIHFFQHVPFEGIAILGDWAQLHGHTVTGTRFFLPYQLPAPDDFDMLVIMGGPMSVNDEEVYPWLAEEKAFIRQAIVADKIVIGICLGAQLIASALGARVYPNAMKEIGWWPIGNPPGGVQKESVFHLNDPFSVFHWHGDTFDLPEGAIQLFQSTACVNQGFLYKKNVLGLQFHIEVDPNSVKEMVMHGGRELKAGGEWVQSAEAILGLSQFYPGCNQKFFSILDHLFKNQVSCKS